MFYRQPPPTSEHSRRTVNDLSIRVDTAPLIDLVTKDRLVAECLIIDAKRRGIEARLEDFGIPAQQCGELSPDELQQLRDYEQQRNCASSQEAPWAVQSIGSSAVTPLVSIPLE